MKIDTHISGKKISDGNKTKMLRPRPRTVKQQQEYITEKTLPLQHACLLSKNNWV